MALIKHVFRRTKKLADADGSKESSDDEEFGGQDLKRWVSCRQSQWHLYIYQYIYVAPSLTHDLLLLLGNLHRE